MPNHATCRWHSLDPGDIEKRLRESRRGGQSRRSGVTATIDPLSASIDVDLLDLTTPADIGRLLAAAMKAAARLPYSVSVTHALSQCAQVQLKLIETTDLSARLTALEARALATVPPSRPQHLLAVYRAPPAERR